MKMLTDKILAGLFLACVATLLTTSQCGCRQLAPDGVYQGQKVLYEAENTISASYDLVNTFLNWEVTNRAICPPAVTRGADRLRAEFPKAHDTANVLRDAYIASPGGGTEANLKSALTVLRAALGEAAKYMAQATQPLK